jgi:2-polyprenyl-3-methyl-5-hydroxy-6-metoxy-1,4-benzoquinol methylase
MALPMIEDVISPEYQALNRKLLNRMPGYGNGGRRHAVAVAHFAVALSARTILDYGCGQGTLKEALMGLTHWRYHGGRVYEYDPCIKSKAKRHRPKDLVVCTDVLEHVEPEKLDGVLADLRNLSLKGCYVSIATRPSNKRLPDGRNAHLIVESAEWWIGQFLDAGWLLFGAKVGVRKHTEEQRGVQLWLKGWA